MKGLHVIAFILLIIGGLNWLLVGLLNWDVGVLFGGMEAVVSRIIYILVGLAALLELFSHKKCCGACGVKGMKKEMPMGNQPGGGQQM